MKDRKRRRKEGMDDKEGEEGRKGKKRGIEEGEKREGEGAGESEVFLSGGGEGRKKKAAFLGQEAGKARKGK